MMSKSFVIVDNYREVCDQTSAAKDRGRISWDEIFWDVETTNSTRDHNQNRTNEIVSQLTPEYDNHNLMGKEDNILSIIKQWECHGVE